MWYKKVNNLLSKGGNTKTDKNEYLTYNLSLAPYTLNNKGVNMCPMASQGCATACLNETGRGVFSNVSQARINKTNYYVYDRINFLDQLSQEIIGVASRTHRTGEMVALRLNTYSDQDFVYKLRKYVDMDVLNDDFYSKILFYDYTAMPNKVKRYIGTTYYHALSRKEDNEQDVLDVLGMGGNVAAVFRSKLPKTYKGYPVVDGDKTDLEMTKHKGVVLGLIAKGKKAKNDTSGFVID